MRPISTILAAALAITACGGDERPTDAEWGVTWNEQRELVPTEAELATGGRDLCDELVGVYREEFDRLRPTPSGALDDAVDAWIEQAEQIVFECPVDDPDVLAVEYDDLGVLAAEIDAGLAADD